MSNHGPLFDEFHADSGEHHGGSLADEGYRPGPAAAAGSMAATTPTYRNEAPTDAHGARWDEFGWRQMPEHFGRHMDSHFRTPVADGEGHGTYFDVFRGGNAEVRVDVDGHVGLEARVVECHADHAVLELRRPRHADGGGRVEVNIGQIREWRAATQQGQASETRKPTAQVGNTPAKDKASSAEAPSARNAKAHGGPRTEVDTAVATGSVFANKTVDDTLVDLRKIAGLEA